MHVHSVHRRNQNVVRIGTPGSAAHVLSSRRRGETPRANPEVLLRTINELVSGSGGIARPMGNERIRSSPLVVTTMTGMPSIGVPVVQSSLAIALRYAPAYCWLLRSIVPLTEMAMVIVQRTTRILSMGPGCAYRPSII